MQADPGVATVTAYTGGGGGRGTTVNTARMFVALKPRKQRDATADQIITRLRPKLARVPGATLYLQAVQDIRVGGRIGNAQYQYTLQADSLRDLSEWAPRMLQALRGLPELRDVSSDQQDAGLQVPLTIDRDSAARVGVSTKLIDETLYSAFGQRQVSTIYTALNQYHVVMEVAPEYWQSPDALSGIHVRSQTGASVPLTALTRFQPSAAPLQVNHQGLFPSVTISFNLAPAVSLGHAVAAVEDAGRRIALPSSVRGKFAGAAQAFQDSLSTQPLLILAALVAVYIVLGMLYESYVHPLTILSTLPSAGVGALLALMICRMDLSIIAIIGIILLIGIVKKNAIMVIDVALDLERREGRPPPRRHLRRVPAAAAADPDDHHGRDAGRPAARARRRHRLRAAAPARGEHHRRPHAEPAPHALHDPGRVPLPRALAAAHGERLGARRRADRRAPSRHQISGGK